MKYCDKHSAMCGVWRCKEMMGGYTFLLAGYDDIPEIISIYRSLIGTPGCAWNMYYPNRKLAESDINSKSLYILKENEKIIAVASAGEFNELGHMQWKPKMPCELARVAVIPTMQRQGIGTIILQYIVKAVKEKGFDGMRFLVSKANHAALTLYDKNGFERCGEAFMYDIDFYRYQIEFNFADEMKT
jgi:ribosomal protein S18 acetylase RimI-like enzyme